MKKILFILLFIFLGLTSFAQSNIRLKNYWENTYYINPASIYSEFQYVASVAGRKQWIGFTGAPSTEYVTFVARMFTDKTQLTQIGQIGLKVFHDNIGFTKIVNISPSYSYSLRMHKNRRMNLGFAYKLQSVSYDMSKSNLDIIGDPAIYATETKWSNHNVDLGVEYIGKSFIAGASSQNLISLFTGENNLQTNTNFLYGIYQTDLDKSFNLLFGICGINNVNIYQAEMNLSLLSSTRNHDFRLGLSFSTRQEFGVLFGIDLSNTVRLAFSYDYHTGGISHSSFGSPEVLLVWKINKLRNCQCKEIYK
jgi:type IX secretion system PorP/SprF family membrane protein